MSAPLLVALAAAATGAQLARFAVPGRFRRLYEQLGREQLVDPNLLHALAVHESGDDPSLPGRQENPNARGALNRDGTRDYGLFQINERNFSRYGLTPENVFDPRTNGIAAARLLNDNVAAARHLSLTDQISVYNAGFSTETKRGEPLRPKLAADGSYWNAEYVRQVWSWYLLVSLAALAPIRTGWDT